MHVRPHSPIPVGTVLPHIGGECVVNSVFQVQRKPCIGAGHRQSGGCQVVEDIRGVELMKFWKVLVR